MEMVSQKILNMVFKRNVRDNTSDYKLDFQMLKVLGELDGTRDVATVSARLGIPPINLAPILKKLNQQRLIVPVATHPPPAERLSPEIFSFMETELANMIGPVAAMVIGDCIRKMGEQREYFPAIRAGELVDAICAKIIVETHKNQFLRLMRSKISEKGR